MRLPWKTVSLEFFTVLKYILSFRIFEQLALAMKTELPWNFLLYWIYFLHSGFLSNLRLPWKKSVPWIHCTEYIFFFIQDDFWATCACPEKQSGPGIFHCIEIFFIIQDFLSTSACPENSVCPEIFQTQGGPPPDPQPRTPMCIAEKRKTKIHERRRGYIHCGCRIYAW